MRTVIRRLVLAGFIDSLNVDLQRTELHREDVASHVERSRGSAAESKLRCEGRHRRVACNRSCGQEGKVRCIFRGRILALALGFLSVCSDFDLVPAKPT